MGPFATHRLLVRIALSAAHIFAWLFVFQYFYISTGSALRAFTASAGAYALAQTISILLTPYAARRLRHGVRGMLVNALLSLSAAFAILATAFSGSLGSVSIGIVCFAIAMGLYRSLYWIPYELASRRQPKSRLVEIGLALVPALSGFLMARSEVAPIFMLAAASILALIAIIPVYAIRNTHEGFSWGYRETFAHLFSESHRRPLLQAICDGFEGAALLLLWPITVFMLLGWSLTALGLVLSATILCTIAARAIFSGAHERIRSPIVVSALAFSGWMLRGSVAAPFSIVLVDTYYRSGSGVSERGVDFVTAEQTADSNTYVDEITALKDMGQGFGRVLFCLVAGALSPFFSFPALALWLFFIAALFAVSSVAISRSKPRRAF